MGYSSAVEPEKVLVVSSGVHGVEGFFGSSVQLSLLEKWRDTTLPRTKCVFLHGLNPHGFAWCRRFDENNVDPNRNFLRTGERFEGTPKIYAHLDPFLNPPRPPSRWEPFTLKALGLVAKHGMRALQQAVASGQYDYPQGLFFGGKEPSRMQQFLEEHMPRFLKESRRVIHLDFHTGLGPSASGKLLIDFPLSPLQRNWLTKWFGEDSFEGHDHHEISYNAKGGIGQWCVSRGLSDEYMFACAEFGTYSPIQILAGLRAENQTHHWCKQTDPVTKRTKERLRELFCPASELWRSKVIERSHEVVDSAVEGILD